MNKVAFQKRIMAGVIALMMLSGCQLVSAPMRRNEPTRIMSDVVAIGCGGTSTLAIKSDNSLWIWKYGNGVPEEILSGVVCATAGWDHYLAIKADGSLWAWGYNDDGQVGTDQSDMGSNNKISTVADPQKVMDDVVAISAEYYTSFAIKADQSLWGWGSNYRGQLGNGMSGVNTKESLPIKIMEDVSDVCTGGYHTLALKTDGSLWAWGSNSFGELGDGTQQDRSVPIEIMDDVIAISAGSSSSFAIKSDGSLWAWGSNTYGDLGNGISGEDRYELMPIQIAVDVAAISSGNHHSLALKNDGSLWTWGFNEFGQLGDGTRQRSSIPINILDEVVSINAGICHSVALKNDGSLWGWGYAAYNKV
jgi:Alpha-tubulin suppressor and related RCC1 domain-containing proteins